MGIRKKHKLPKWPLSASRTTTWIVRLESTSRSTWSSTLATAISQCTSTLTVMTWHCQDFQQLQQGRARTCRDPHEVPEPARWPHRAARHHPAKACGLRCRRVLVRQRTAVNRPPSQPVQQLLTLEQLARCHCTTSYLRVNNHQYHMASFTVTFAPLQMRSLYLTL